MKSNKRYKIRMIGNNCIPERSRAFNYEKRVIMLDGMTRHYITTVAYTIGITNNAGRVLFTRDLYTFDRYDLIHLLDIYKALKEKTGLNDIKPVLIKLKVEE